MGRFSRIGGAAVRPSPPIQAVSTEAQLSGRGRLFFALAFGAEGVGAWLGELLSGPRAKKRAATLILLSLIIGITGTGMIVTGGFAAMGRLLISLAAALATSSIAAHGRGGRSRALLHMMNAAYVLLSAYFVAMIHWPMLFPTDWLDFFPVAYDAFDVLLASQLFHATGYLLAVHLHSLLRPFINPVARPITRHLECANVRPQEDFVVFAVLLGIGSIGRVINFASGAYWYLQGSSLSFETSSFVSQFDRIYYLGWIYGIATFLTRRRALFTPIVLVSIILAALEIVYQLLSGSKGRFFVFVIQPIAVVYVLSRLNVPRKALLSLLVLGAVSWLVIYPVLVKYRLAVSEDSPDDATTATHALVDSAKHATKSDNNEYLDIVLTPFMKSNRAEQVAALSSIVMYHPAQPPEHLWQRLTLFWIPRFIWNDKPEALSGNLIGRLTGRVASHNLGTSVISTGPGEAFLYYGFAGTALMLLAGLLLYVTERIISPFHRRTPFRIALFAVYSATPFGVLSGHFEAQMTGFVMQMGALALTLSVANVFIKGQRHGSGGALRQSRSAMRARTPRLSTTAR